MSGRLGNQFFRYAIGRKIQYLYERYNPELILHFSKNKFAKTNDFWGYQLEDFAIDDSVKIDVSDSDWKNYGDFFQRILLLLYIPVRRLLKNRYRLMYLVQSRFDSLLVRNGLYLNAIGYTPICVRFKNGNSLPRKTIIVNGNYEAPQFFSEIRHVLLKEFTPKVHFSNEVTKYKFENLLETILRTNSICVSVRRGDFLEEKFEKKYNVCTKEYFLSAIAKMQELIEDARFVFFSDDIEFVKKEFTDLKNVLFESDDNTVAQKVKLMTSCKHFIISNSTFSWWMQYLSEYENKKVIAPSKWYKNCGNFKVPLLEDSFILIDSDGNIKS